MTELRPRGGHPASKWQSLDLDQAVWFQSLYLWMPKRNRWFSAINLLLPQCSQLSHYQLFNPKTKRSSFDSSFFLTPPCNPLANDFSSTPQKDLDSIYLSPLPRAFIFCLDCYESLRFLSTYCCHSYEGWFPGNPFFFLHEEEGRSSVLSKLFLALGPFLLFSKNTYEVPTMGRHCFCVLRDKECHGQSKNKEADALPDKMTKY